MYFDAQSELALVLLSRGKLQRAQSVLDSFPEGDDYALANLISINIEPAMSALRAEPRYKALLREMKLPNQRIRLTAATPDEPR
jgi:hypothetical protein